MESHKVESLLEKYFEAETSVAEEQQLQEYFNSDGVAQHLMQYKGMFCYYSVARQEKPEQQVPLKPAKPRAEWLSWAASAAVLLGVGSFLYFNSQRPQDLGTFDDPAQAFAETQKALELLSGNVNKGFESVNYVGEYEATKQIVFAH